MKNRDAEVEKGLKEIVSNHEDNHYKILFDEEGITKEDLELVDLRWFSPVIPFNNCHPVEVTQTRGGDYIVPGYPIQPVPADVLKVMRYRYLISRSSITYFKKYEDTTR